MLLGEAAPELGLQLTLLRAPLEIADVAQLPAVPTRWDSHQLCFLVRWTLKIALVALWSCCCFGKLEHSFKNNSPRAQSSRHVLEGKLPGLIVVLNFESQVLDALG